MNPFSELYLALLETSLVGSEGPCLARCILEIRSWLFGQRYIALATHNKMVLVEHKASLFGREEIHDVLTIPWTNVEALRCEMRGNTMNLSLRALCEATMIGALPTRSRGLFSGTFRVVPLANNIEHAQFIADAWRQLAEGSPSSRIVARKPKDLPHAHSA